MTRQGFTLEHPKEVYDTQVEGNSIVAFGPYVQVQRRGNTLDGGLITMEISSPLEEVICIKLTNHMGGRGNCAQFLLEDSVPAGATAVTDLYYLLDSGKATARLNKGAGWKLEILYNGMPITCTNGRPAAHIKSSGGQSFIRESLLLDCNEAIYGLGERFGPLVKNGQSVDMWNADGGTESEQSYKNIPFFLSSKGYGVFVRHCGNVSFEIGSEAVSSILFSVEGESLEYYFFTGGSMQAALGLYTRLFGRSPLVPDWSYGLWLSTSFTTDYNEKTVLSFIDGMLETEIPLSVFHFDCFWMKEFEWSSFLWNTELFPQPQRMLERIHQRGLKISVWINPYIAQKSPLFKEGYDNNYFVNTGSGDVWQWDRWQAGMALVDFTNPDAVIWYLSKLDALIDMGVDTFKTDFGERIPVQSEFYGSKAFTEGVSYHNGNDAWSMHNYYAYLYNQAVFQLLEKRYGQGGACLFARAATAGTQKFPVNWGGDNLSNYQSMANSLRGGLSLGACGFAYWSHDIGGFESGCTPDIYKRWTQFGLLSSHSRYHGNQEYKVPWLYGEEAVEVTRRFTRLKNRLLPYLHGLSCEARDTGLPLMRGMFLEFESNHACRYLSGQYMLGSALLVAPIFNADGIAEYYLPKGHWVNILTHEVISGEKHGYFTLPLLLRNNHILLLGNEDDNCCYDYAESLTICIGCLDEGKEISVPVCAHGAKVGGIAVKRSGETLAVTCHGFAPELTVYNATKDKTYHLVGSSGIIIL